jgi:hypothetical protein
MPSSFDMLPRSSYFVVFVSSAAKCGKEAYVKKFAPVF